MPNAIDTNTVGLTMIGSSSSLDERDKQMLNKSRNFFHLLCSVSERLQTTPEVCESMSQLIEGTITHQQCLDRLKELLRFTDSSRSTFSSFITDILPVLRRLILSDHFDYNLLPVRQCDKLKVQRAMQGSGSSASSNIVTSIPSSMSVSNVPRPITPTIGVPTLENSQQRFVRPSMVPVTLRPIGTALPANFRHIQPRPNVVPATQLSTRPYYSVVNGVSQPLRVPTVDMGSVRILQSVNVLSVPPQTTRPSTTLYPAGTPVAVDVRPVGTATTSSGLIATPHIIPPLKRPRTDTPSADGSSVNQYASVEQGADPSRTTPANAGPGTIVMKPNLIPVNVSVDSSRLQMCKAIRSRLEALLLKSSGRTPSTTASSSSISSSTAVSGITVIGDDAVLAMSAAVENYLRDVYSELALQAKARTMQIATTLEHDSASQVDNIQSQLNFLLEVDKAEQQRGILRDQENCRRAAQSKSRDLDPVTQQLKDRYREMTNARQEQEAMNASNLTALQAIGGGRHKLRAWEMAASEESSESLLRVSQVGSAAATFGEDAPSANPTLSATRPLPPGATWTASSTGRLPSGAPVNQRYRLQHEDLVRHVRNQRLLIESNAFRRILSKQLSTSASAARHC